MLVAQQSLDKKVPKNQARKDIQHFSFFRLDVAVVLLWLELLRLDVRLNHRTLYIISLNQGTFYCVVLIGRFEIEPVKGR